MKDNRIMVGNGNVVGTELSAVSGDSVAHPNFTNKKYYVGWGQWEENVTTLCNSIKRHKDYLFVYGVPRGGVTLSTMVSHKLGIPMIADQPGYWMLDWYHWRMRQGIELQSDCKNILVVDAICDTGKTLDYLKTEIDNNVKITDDSDDKYTFDIAVVDADPSVMDKIDYHVNVKNPKQWLVYPWEVGSKELEGKI